jgi:hypothetical protein
MLKNQILERPHASYEHEMHHNLSFNPEFFGVRIWAKDENEPYAKDFSPTTMYLRRDEFKTNENLEKIFQVANKKYGLYYPKTIKVYDVDVKDLIEATYESDNDLITMTDKQTNKIK